MGVGFYRDPAHDKLPQWQKRKAWSISPANPDSYNLLESLLSEFLPCFSANSFNACCDETWDLGMGQSYKEAQKSGKQAIFLKHIKRLNRISRKHGKKLMIWGDVLRRYPELIKTIPGNVTILDWGYEHDHRFDAIKDFKKARRKVYACPGTSSWASLFPRIHTSSANIAGFAKAAIKNDAQGLICTDWGDGGHYNFTEFSWYGYIFAAEQAWNTKADPSSFTQRFAKVFLNSSDPRLVDAIKDLGDITQLSVSPYYQSVWQHILFADPISDIFSDKLRNACISTGGRIQKKKVALTAGTGIDTGWRIEAVAMVLNKVMDEPRTDPYGILPYWLFATDTIACAAHKLAIFGKGGKNSPAARDQLRGEIISLKKRFEQLWRKRNRVSRIKVTLDKYQMAIDSL
jgi:hypothetical protein